MKHSIITIILVALLAGLPEAKERGYGRGRFSFNVRGGRCETCAGEGFEKVEMQFLSDLYVTCPDCEGRRYKPSTLDIRYRGRSIADVLDMPVAEAVEFFGNHFLPRSMRVSVTAEIIRGGPQR